jgi:hypothetical protein
MSIRAMTWAFSLPLEPRAKLALLAIADNARDDGIAWPSRDMIAEKSTQSRATINRRMKILSDLGVIELKERFREDGSQTTDEIRLDLALSPAEVMRRMQGLSAADRGEEADESANCDSTADGPEAGEGGYQPDTPPVQSGHPGDAVVTRGGLHSGHPLNEPSLEPSTPPNPPPGGDGPLKKADKEANERREALWQRFVGSYPGIGPMDQGAAREEFWHLSIDDAEWAVSVLPTLKEDLRKAARAPKNAHIWLRKGMFRNYPRSKIDAPPPESAWVVEGSDQDQALRFIRYLAKVPSPFVRSGAGGARGYPHRCEIGPDLLAMLIFVNDTRLRWTAYPRGSPEFAAWQTRFKAWIGHVAPTEPGSDCLRVPCRWPPKKDGTIYRDDDPQASQEPDHA